jgi:hypothetical protein
MEVRNITFIHVTQNIQISPYKKKSLKEVCYEFKI